MKTVILCLSLLATAWALPMGETELEFKRLYVDPTVDTLPQDLAPRITNGKEAVPHSIPFQAYLVFVAANGSRWLCGGSLISELHVLTAAHCVENGVEAIVYLGAHNIRESESNRLVVQSHRLIVHEDYNREGIQNDIGIVVLDQPVELNENVNVVALPTSGQIQNSYEGEEVRISGWGRVFGQGSTSPVLLEVNSTVISNTQCKRFFSIVLDSQLCTSGLGGVGSCSGDSGGPLVANNALIGVVSYGAAGCPAGYPSAFSRVTSYVDWIERNTGLKF